MEYSTETLESQPAPRNPIWGAWATVGLGFATFFIYSFAQGIVSVVVMVAMIAADPGLISFAFDFENIPLLGFIISLSTITSAIAGCGIIVVFIKARQGASIKDYLGLQPVSIKTILIILGIALGFTVAESLITNYVEIPSSTGLFINAYETSLWLPLLWMALILFAPLFEEVFFRGFLFSGLQHSRIGITGTILVTSLVWTSLHAFQYNAYELSFVFLMGLLLGLARHRTGSLWGPLLMHMFWNLLATISLALTVNGVI